MASAAEASDPLGEVKGYLTSKLKQMCAAAHDFVCNGAAYEKITISAEARNGRIISNRNGNLFHYVIEPTLWGTKPYFLVKLNAEAQAKMKPIQFLPQAEVVTAASEDCARKLDELAAVANAWQPTMDERLFRRLARLAL